MVSIYGIEELIINYSLPLVCVILYIIIFTLTYKYFFMKLLILYYSKYVCKNKFGTFNDHIYFGTLCGNFHLHLPL